MANDENKKGIGWLSFLIGFVIGGITSIISWILFVPKETKEKAEELGDIVKEKSVDIKEKVVEVKDTAVYIGEGIGQVAAEYAKEGKEFITDKARLVKDKVVDAVRTGKEAFIKKKEELTETQQEEEK